MFRIPLSLARCILQGRSQALPGITNGSTLQSGEICNGIRAIIPAIQVASLHSSTPCTRDGVNFPKEGEISPFLEHNKKKYPPLQPGEARRPAFVCHEKRNIKYPLDKMWYVARLIRGMTIEDAINQMKFCHKKGAVAVLETLLEAQKIAVEEHNVEFASNLWVSESFYMKDSVIKGIRRHARARFGIVRYVYVRYCCTLEEGTPPEHYYYYTRPLKPEEQLQKWLDKRRNKLILRSL